MAIICATPNNEIVCHDDFGILIVECDHYASAYQNGEWWIIDDDGYLTDRVKIH